MNKELELIQEAYISMITEAPVTFEPGEVVSVKWHENGHETDHGTTNIDKATKSFAHAPHPTIKDLMIKVHQGSGAEPGAGGAYGLRGRYKFHKVK